MEKGIIKQLLQKSYKGSVVEVENISFSGDYLVIKPTVFSDKNVPFAALRILRKFPEVRVVHFTGGWIEGVYTRETLRWAGYKI